METDLRRLREGDLNELERRGQAEAQLRDEEKAVLTRRLTAAREEADALRAQADALRRTWSWRLTRPLRLLPTSGRASR